SSAHLLPAPESQRRSFAPPQPRRRCPYPVHSEILCLSREVDSQRQVFRLKRDATSPHPRPVPALPRNQSCCRHRRPAALSTPPKLSLRKTAASERQKPPR